MRICLFSTSGWALQFISAVYPCLPFLTSIFPTLTGLFRNKATDSIGPLHKDDADALARNEASEGQSLPRPLVVDGELTLCYAWQCALNKYKPVNIKQACRCD